MRDSADIHPSLRIQVFSCRISKTCITRHLSDVSGQQTYQASRPGSRRRRRGIGGSSPSSLDPPSAARGEIQHMAYGVLSIKLSYKSHPVPKAE